SIKTDNIGFNTSRLIKKSKIFKKIFIKKVSNAFNLEYKLHL
ncbi:14031_t:CDS:1, partial [Racocetra fulgida]